MLYSKLLIVSTCQRKLLLRKVKLRTHCGLRTRNSSRKISESMQLLFNFLCSVFMHASAKAGRVM